jgi:hypothetical protein
MVTGQKEKRQGQCVSWNCDNRFEHVAHTMLRMPNCVSATKQRMVNHKAPAPAGGRNNFIHDRFVAPNEAMAIFDYAPEKILIFTTRSKLEAEWRLRGIEDSAAEKNVSSAAFLPGHHKASRMGRTLIKAALNQPLGRFVFEMGFYRTKHACNAISFACSKKIQQPAGGGEFVVINERNKVTCGMRDGRVAGYSNIAFSLDGVRNIQVRFSTALVYGRSAALRRVIIDDHDRIGKSPVCFLLGNFSQQPFQHRRPLTGADANRNARRHG